MAFKNFDELNEYYTDMYGQDWTTLGRGCLSPSAEENYIHMCYEIYDKMALKDFFDGVLNDLYNGRKFKIVDKYMPGGPISNERLPAYLIEFTDTGEGHFAKPEEIFMD